MLLGIFIGVYVTVLVILFLMGGAEDWKEFLAIIFWPACVVLGLGYVAFSGIRRVLNRRGW